MFRTGTSGWSYDSWRGLFYPEGLKKTGWLDHYAETFDTVEVNSSFYHISREEVLAKWAAHTPDGFLFAIKAWRAITHRKRLKDCADEVRVFLDRLRALKGKLGPVLFQLPPRMPADPERLERFLELLPGGLRGVFEFRDPRWHTDEVYALLEKRNAAFCCYELAGNVSPRLATADFVYVRLHGQEVKYKGSYSDEALADWADWVRGNMAEGRAAFVYFDNTDEKDYALRNAIRMRELLAEEGGG